MTIKYRSIVNIRWSDDLITEIKDFKKNETLPNRLSTYHKQWKFKKLYSQFTHGNDDKLYLVIEDEQDLKKNYKDEEGNMLFDIDLPIKLRVVVKYNK